MAWFWTLLGLLVKYGPVVYSIVKEILTLIKDLKGTAPTLAVSTTEFSTSNVETHLKDAIVRFKESKDSTELRGLLSRLRMLKHSLRGEK